MNSRLFLGLAIPVSFLITACTTAEGFPSLEVRDSERITGSMAVPAAPAYTPAPPSLATTQQLDSLTATAREAHIQFLAAAAEARRPVELAARSNVGSDRWAQAQVAVAGLESIRSNAMFALADIDQLYSDASLQGGETEQLEAARTEISALVDEENRQIAALLDGLAF